MGFKSPNKILCYTRKTYNGNQYTWCPDEFEKRNVGSGIGGKKFFCTAKPYSQGEDWITTYVYDIRVTPEAVQQRVAYVECDYVK